MWVVRDRGTNGSVGRLRLFVIEKPSRHIYYDIWTVLGGNAVNAMGSCPKGYDIDISPELFPELTWDDEPLEVSLLPSVLCEKVNELTDSICGFYTNKPRKCKKGDILVSMKKVNEIMSKYVGSKR